MLLEDSRLGQECISPHNNNYFLYIQEKVSMECRNDFDCRKPANLLVYFRQVPNSVYVCFLGHSMCTVFKKFNTAESCKIHRMFPSLAHLRFMKRHKSIDRTSDRFFY